MQDAYSSTQHDLLNNSCRCSSAAVSKFTRILLFKHQDPPSRCWFCGTAVFQAATTKAHALYAVKGSDEGRSTAAMALLSLKRHIVIKNN